MPAAAIRPAAAGLSRASNRITPTRSTLPNTAPFIAALGKRYDGTPGMEFLDIGSYGIWDE
jgi:hypothetical protein